MSRFVDSSVLISFPWTICYFVCLTVWPRQELPMKIGICDTNLTMIYVFPLVTHLCIKY